MDILGCYAEQNPQTIAQPYAQFGFSPDSFLIRLVKRLSGGRITDKHQALFTLLVFACAGLVFAGVLAWWGTSPVEHPLINAPPPEDIGR